jgi:hypothetical protein
MPAHAGRAAALLAVLLTALVAVVPAVTASVPGSGPIVVGIVLREAGAGPSFAVIEDPATSTTGFYPVGASVGAARVTQILADRVILMAGDQQTLLRLATTVTPAPAASSGAARESSGPRRGVSTDAGSAQPPASPYGRIAAVFAPAGGATGGSATDAGGPNPMGIASQAGGPGGASGAQGSQSATLSLTGRTHTGHSQAGDEFSATSLRDLLIAMTYSDVSGTRQRLELYAPDGSLYQKFTGPLAPSTQTLVPVGGTWITDHSLYGIWRIDVYVDRDTTPIATTTFTLIP